MPLNSHGRRKRESVISPTEDRQDVKHRAEWSWRITAASFPITWDSLKDHKAHFHKIKTQEQSLALPPWTECSFPQQSFAVKLWLCFHRYMRSFTALCFKKQKNLLSRISPAVFFCLAEWEPHLRELKELRNLMDLKFKPSVTKTHFQIPKIWIYKTNTDTALSKEMVGCDPKNMLQSFFFLFSFEWELCNEECQMNIPPKWNMTKASLRNNTWCCHTFIIHQLKFV